jgi:hypothetical protein
VPTPWLVSTPNAEIPAQDLAARTLNVTSSTTIQSASVSLTTSEILSLDAQENQQNEWTLASQILVDLTPAQVFLEPGVFALVIQNTLVIPTTAADLSVPTMKTVHTKRLVSGTSALILALECAVKMLSAEWSTTTQSAPAFRTTLEIRLCDATHLPDLNAPQILNVRLTLHVFKKSVKTHVSPLFVA